MGGRVVTDRQGDVACITIDNPDKANSLDIDLLAGLRDAWRWADADPGITSIVLSATGDSHFCAGINLGLVADPLELAKNDAARSFSSRDCGVSKPVIAAVNGAVVGAGLGLVSGADLVVAARNATFLDPHARLAQVIGFTGVRFGRQLPSGEARRCLLGGVKLTAARAHELGLVTEITEDAEGARDAALRLAGRIGAHSPAAVRANLAFLRSLAWPELADGTDDVVKLAMAAQAEHFTHPDAVEGLRAFAESRPGVWQPTSRRPRKRDD